MSRAVFTLLLASLLMACGDDSEPPAAPQPVEEPPCPIEERLVDDGCVPAGVTACADGFTADDQHGCQPVLPAMRCEDGLMAVPGDSACAPPGACGAAPYGDGPFDASTQYVDAAFTGTSDGSSAMPWPTLQQAIDAAAPDGSVAVAAGRYSQNVNIQKPLSVLGRCSQQVTIEGSGGAAITIGSGAGGTVLRGVAVTGSGPGVFVEGAEGVLVEQVHIHDTGDVGLWVRDDSAPASVSASRLLLERAEPLAISVYGATLELQQSTVRNTIARASDSAYGWNASIEDHQLTGRRASLAVATSIFEGGQDININLLGADLELRASIVRDTVPDPVSAERGWGVHLAPGVETGDPSNALISGSLISNNRAVGISMFTGALELEQSVVSDTQPEAAADWFGRGISAEDLLDGNGRPLLQVTDSLLVRNRAAGIVVLNGQATLEGVRVDDTLVRQADGGDGDGLVGQTDPDREPTWLDISYCAFERNRSSGVTLLGARAFMRHSAVRDTTGDTDLRFGRGITVQANMQDGIMSDLTLEASLVERSRDVGVAVTDALLTMSTTTVRETAENEADGFYGDGVAVYGWFQDRAAATITDSRIEESARAGLAVFGTQVAVVNSALLCNPIAINGEDDFDIEDRGGNRCGCGDDETACQVQSAGLTPPSPVRDAQ